ncbi:MAG: aminotransferase class V-fold PLP-dependent enzyme [Chloroflexota bacterium]
MTTTLLPIDEAEASSYRAQFPIFQRTVYLNSCSLGPLSNPAAGALAEYCAAWSDNGAPVWWKAWLEKLEAARERFARLIGADPSEVAIGHSVSSALSSVAACFDYSTRGTVLCADLDFPTIPYQWLAKPNVSVEYAASSSGIEVSLDAYEASLVANEVALIATSHVFYATGAIQPVRELADLAHEYGARIVVDGYHAVGAIRVDVKELGVDFYVGGTLKWLMGGPGLTFIYVRPDLIPGLQPSIAGWFSSGNQFTFDAKKLDRAADAGRLQLGTPAVATAYSGIAGMDMVLEVSPERIYPRLQNLTERVIRHAQDAGYGIRSPLQPEKRGGIVMLEVSKPDETVAALADRGFTIDARPGLIRVSPHFFNTQADVDGLMEALRAIQIEFGRGSS